MTCPPTRVSVFAWDRLIAFVLVIGTVTEEAFRGVPWPPARVIALTLSVAAAMSIGWRRVAPVPVAGLSLTAMVASAVLTEGAQENFTQTLVVTIGVYSAVVYSRQWRFGLATFAAMVVAVAAADLADYGDPLQAVVISLSYSTLIFGVAATVRRTRIQSAAEGRRADGERELSEQRVQAAVSAERAMIARELHDVVAHALGICVLQARGGRKVLDHDGQAAREAFTTIETTGHQALVEMRRLVGLLRQSDLDLLPQPGLRDLESLIDLTLLPPLRGTVVVHGDPASVPPGLDITAYRIVQEALTNVLKHASAKHVTVRVDVDSKQLRLEVEDDGEGGTAHPGNGLIGMRERAALFGGQVQAEELAAGGFRVSAQIPIGSSP
jgi:signal transduction histidine kinase